MKVSIEEVNKNFAFRNKINACDLKDLVIIHNGKEEKIPEEVIEKWRYIGLNNMYLLGDYQNFLKNLGEV